MIVLLGYNGQQWLNDLFSFDLGTKEWYSVNQSGKKCVNILVRQISLIKIVGQPPASRFGYVSVVHNNFFVVFGGGLSYVLCQCLLTRDGYC